MKNRAEIGVKEDRQILGLMLVRNDDRFVGQALRNVLDFCDNVIVLEHCSTDRTLEILTDIASTTGGKVEIHRIRDVAESHDFVLPWIGRPIWMLAVDGDEVYDPSGLVQLRRRIQQGEFDGYWRLYGHVLNVTRLNPQRGLARGHTSPPGHPMTKLYHLGAIQSWVGAPQRLHGGTMALKPEWDLKKGVYAFFHHVEWEESPFRCLHMVFVRRSSRQESFLPRLSPADVLQHKVLGVDIWARAKVWLYREWMLLRRKSGKDLAYRKGPLVEKETHPFHLLESVQ